MDKVIQLVSAAVLAVVVIILGVMAWGILSGPSVEPEPEHVINYEIEEVRASGNEHLEIDVVVDSDERPSEIELEDVSIAAMHDEEGRWVDETIVRVHGPDADPEAAPYLTAVFEEGALVEVTTNDEALDDTPQQSDP